MQVLDSVKVLEIGGLGPGPFCAMHLADLGADVIAVVRREAAAGPTGNLLNRGKRSVFADLKTPEGKALVLALVREADVLIEGMRPGVMERLGLGRVDCMAVNPRVVYGRMTGWGQSGPLSQRAGHDNNYAAVSGALWGCSPADARPVSSFAMVGDIGGGALYLMTGLLAGIINARQTGQGTVVDAAIVDGAAHMLNLALSARQKGVVTDARGTSIHDSAPFYETYVCADGAHITIGSIEPQFYALLRAKTGLDADPDFDAQDDQTRWPQHKEKLTALFATKTRDEWCAIMEMTDICFAPVLSLSEAPHHPHNVERKTFIDVGGTVMPAPAPRYSETVTDHPTPAPKVGADCDAVLASLLTRGLTLWLAVLIGLGSTASLALAAPTANEG